MYARALLFTLICALPLAAAQTSPGGQAKADPSANLEKVLNRMDASATQFRSAEAHLRREQYQKVINESDVQEGKVYFRRNGKNLQMIADMSEPSPRQILYSNGKVQLFEPKLDRVTVYSPGKSRSDVESFVVLGFGGGGHELLKTFDVKYVGSENLNGVETDKLELIPKSDRLRGMFESVVMWVDPKLGVAVQQKFFQPEGDYNLTKYSDIHINEKVPNDVFKLKTDSKTKYVSPQG